MPISEEDIKVLQEKLFKPLEEKLAASEKKIADFETQFPSMSKKHAADAETSAKKLIEEWANKLPKPEEKNTSKPDEMDALRKQIEALTQANVKAQEEKETETRKAEVARAMSKFKIVKGLEDYAQADLLKIVDRDSSGKLVLKFKDNIAGTEVDRQLDIEKGVERFLKEKTVFVQADVKGGVGAGSGNSFSGGVKPTHQQLMQNPKLHAEWLQTDPEHVQAEANKAIAELDASRAKR